MQDIVNFNLESAELNQRIEAFNVKQAELHKQMQAYTNALNAYNAEIDSGDGVGQKQSEPAKSAQ